MSTMKVAVGGLMLALGLGAAQAKEQLLYGGYFPTTHEGTAVMDRILKEISDASEGMRWEVHAGGAMGGAKELLGNVRDGIVHGGHIVDIYTPSDLPAHVVLVNLALAAQDNLASTAAVNELILLGGCPQCTAELARNEVVPLAYFSSTPQVLMCNKPIESLAGLSGQKVRSVGPVGAAMKALGAVPMSTASTELYDALQRGQVNCASGAKSWLQQMRLEEVAKVVYEYPIAIYISSNPFNMNKKAWDRLSAADRKLMRSRAADVAAGWAIVYHNDDLRAAAEGGKKGVAFRALPADIEQALAAYREGEAKRAADWGTSKGVQEADRIVAGYLLLYRKWLGIVKETGADPVRYRDALAREIFNKVE